jgi:hypothetical protein
MIEQISFLEESTRKRRDHVSVLRQRDRFGRDAQWIEYHPAYRELGNVRTRSFSGLISSSAHTTLGHKANAGSPSELAVEKSARGRSYQT